MGSAKTAIRLPSDARARFRVSRYGYYALHSTKGLQPLQLSGKSIPSQEFTISFWMKPRSEGGEGRGNVIRLDGSAHMQICTSDGTLGGSTRNQEIICYRGGVPGPGVAAMSTGSGSLLYNQWTHYTVTAKPQPDGKTCKYCIYLNGNLKFSQSYGHNPQAVAFNFLELSNEQARNLYFDGLIDEFAIFNHAITEQQNKQLYESATSQ